MFTRPHTLSLRGLRVHELRESVEWTVALCRLRCIRCNTAVCARIDHRRNLEQRGGGGGWLSDVLASGTDTHLHTPPHTSTHNTKTDALTFRSRFMRWCSTESAVWTAFAAVRGGTGLLSTARRSRRTSVRCLVCSAAATAHSRGKKGKGRAIACVGVCVYVYVCVHPCVCVCMRVCVCVRHLAAAAQTALQWSVSWRAWSEETTVQC